jgi:hypothetical protein
MGRQRILTERHETRKTGREGGRGIFDRINKIKMIFKGKSFSLQLNHINHINPIQRTFLPFLPLIPLISSKIQRPP